MKWKWSKVLFAGFCVPAAALLCLGGPPGQMRTNATLRWTYPTNELSTNLLFKLYSTTNISSPVSTWPLFVTVMGTNTQVTIPIVTEQRFFTMTASNWHGESVFSNVASIPPPPRSDEQLTLGP